MKNARCRMYGILEVGEELGSCMYMGVHGPRVSVL